MRVDGEARARTTARQRRAVQRIAHARVAATASSTVVHDEAGDAVVDHLGDRAAAERHHRRAAGHRFDHHQAERLGPVDGEQQRRGAAEEVALLCCSSISPMNSTSGWSSSGAISRLEVVAVGRVDLGGDLQRHAACRRRSRSRDRRASPARCGRGTPGSRPVPDGTAAGRAAGRDARRHPVLRRGSGWRCASEIDTTGTSLNSSIERHQIRADRAGRAAW